MCPHYSGAHLWLRGELGASARAIALAPKGKIYQNRNLDKIKKECSLIVHIDINEFISSTSSEQTDAFESLPVFKWPTCPIICSEHPFGLMYLLLFNLQERTFIIVLSSDVGIPVLVSLPVWLAIIGHCRVTSNEAANDRCSATLTLVFWPPYRIRNSRKSHPIRQV